MLKQHSTESASRSGATKEDGPRRVLIEVVLLVTLDNVLAIVFRSPERQFQKLIAYYFRLYIFFKFGL